MQRFIPLLLVLLTLAYCAEQPEVTGPIYPDRDIDLEPVAARELAGKIRAETNVEVSDDLELSLWASDSLIADPVAISVAPDGRVFYTSANRPISSEFDIRGHRDWMTASISFESVEDRRDFLRKTFEQGSDQSERHLKDLNEDGVRDWRDLTVEKDEVWFVEDRSGNGVADHAKLYIEDFNEEVTDVTNGVEYADGQVYISVGPDLWKTSDTDADGIADEKESLSHGWIVHIGFGGHGMSGVTVGPQGRIWWGGGDVGMNVIDKDGQEHKYPNEGTIVRCDPDGTNFEVFAHGLRNTHEFVFDDLGNLISEDNDGDHSGESERLVYLIDGSDSGWRINWQFGKYTDPDNNDYKVWMEERMYEPRWEGQAAYFLPPIQNYVNGPTGFVYNPGTALGPEYYRHFFVAEFRGNPANSPVHAFTLEPEGAGFKLGSTREVVSGLLPTGIDFGADGALYVADWINGWNPKQEGRIWKLDVPGGADTPIRQEVKRLLNLQLSELGLDTLAVLLAHQDQRVRKNAQFELVKRGNDGYLTLLNTARKDPDQFARIHGLWGMAQMARAEPGYADELASFLVDNDPEIVAQAAKMIGDVRFEGAGTELIDLLEREEPRVVFMATEALGRTENKDAVQPILDMIERNDDEDVYLRMAGMIALGRIGQTEPLVALQDSPSRALRTAAVVALRRMESPEIARFLDDEEEYIVAEAARGINDDLSIPDALPALAATLDDPRFTSEPLLRRAINANVRVGGQESVERLVAYANRGNAPAELRAEAISALAVWAHPSVFDRVDGRYRGEFEQDSTVAAAALAPRIAGLMTRGDEAVRLAAIEAAGKLNLEATIPQLTQLLATDRSTLVRTEALNALHQLGAPDLDRNLETALADRDGNVRARALEILPSSGISEDRSVLLYDKVLQRGTVVEQQAALLGLSQIKGESVDALFADLLDRLEADNIPTEVKLDLAEAVEQHGNPQLNAILTDYAGTVDGDLGLYAFALEGGNAERGRNLFYRNESAQCVRCHAIFEYGGNVGPGLEGIADQLSQRQLLEALIRPSARLAPGYETILVTLNDGTVTAGTVMRRTPEEITLKIGKEDIQTIQRSDIAEEETVPSSMPSMEERLNRREIRDLVAFLSSLHSEES
ncbi:putative membrane-bound dehydrogenase-like protein [Neolewinella xylanilytica]|uniref:Putative membrane-bound dehydrogenase-like protein n=1 Tax=Neolewinella xylanilytica TaxID=1514080 RepID=A0A2S6I334_9BACT|nr:HEAT repeat domain-containing protein [Neolewinella xylanilytica]PPK85481.1 putative membrane-bound dehydrogenase-like protein [Neolewinella xylanilytica]